MSQSDPYDDSMSLLDARALYFEANGFGADGGYNAKWVTGKFGPLPFAFPNSAARRKAVPLHDLHHVITGYGTDGVGEGSISAWEVAGGCRRYWVAWLLNLSALVVGSLLDSRAIWAAFLRGRQSRNYYSRGLDDELLAMSVGAARREVFGEPEQGGDAAIEASLGDRLAFAGWWTLGLALALLQLTLVAAPVLWFGSWLAQALA